MSAWLVIDGGQDGYTTAYTFARAAQPTGAAVTLSRLTGISAMRRALSVPGLSSAPAASLSADLENADGEITRAYAAAPPMRRRAEVRTATGKVFSGIVTGLSLANTATLDIVAGLDRPLSDKMPLRTSAVWGGWRDIRTLPWGYGRVTVSPIQYGADQRMFVLLDHPIAGVDVVKRDGVETPAYAWRNGLDSTGRAVAFLELAEALADGEQMAVTLRGRLHPDTGRPIETPAEILFDIMTNLAGMDVTWADLDDCRAETAGLTLGGLIDNADATIRATIDTLLQSTGSAWSAAMPGIAHLWPSAADPSAPAYQVTPLTAESPTATCQHDDIYTVLRVLYDYDHAAGRASRAVQIEAPDAIREYGRIEMEWNAGWLRSPRHAEELGHRILQAIARPRWRITWNQPLTDIAPGDWADLQHPLLPVSGRHRLSEAEMNFTGQSIACMVEAAAGATPETVTGQLSSAFDPLIQSGITVEIAQNEIIFTARGDTGKPLPGAKVTLDGGIHRVADQNGRVSFPTVRGRHVLLVEAAGYPPSETVVIL